MHERLLLVDDDRDIREVLGSVLVDQGYEVRSAADGEAALRELEAQRPDLILLDIRMPGMDGIEFYHRLRTLEHGEVPVVLMSAYSDLPEIATQLDDCPMIAKPFGLGDLLAVVRRMTAHA